jgi:hypothetical protein
MFAVLFTVTYVPGRCVLHDIFTEIHILDSFKTDPHVCHLYAPGFTISFDSALSYLRC